MLDTILLVAALILLILAGLNVGHPRANLGWLGLACFVLTFLI